MIEETKTRTNEGEQRTDKFSKDKEQWIETRLRLGFGGEEARAFSSFDEDEADASLGVSEESHFRWIQDVKLR